MGECGEELGTSGIPGDRGAWCGRRWGWEGWRGSGREGGRGRSAGACQGSVGRGCPALKRRWVRERRVLVAAAVLPRARTGQTKAGDKGVAAGAGGAGEPVSPAHLRGGAGSAPPRGSPALWSQGGRPAGGSACPAPCTESPALPCRGSCGGAGTPRGSGTSPVPLLPPTGGRSPTAP